VQLVVVVVVQKSSAISIAGTEGQCSARAKAPRSLASQDRATSKAAAAGAVKPRAAAYCSTWRAY
jgi:hypothetical protein